MLGLAKVMAKGQVTLPKSLRDRLGLTVGSRIVFDETASGEVRLRRSDRFSPEDRAFLAGVAEAVRTCEPEALVLLYGSRARSDARPDSDWDFLVVLPGTVTRPREDALEGRLYQLELDDPARVIQPMFCSLEEWRRPRNSVEFFSGVRQEAVEL